MPAAKVFDAFAAVRSADTVSYGKQYASGHSRNLLTYAPRQIKSYQIPKAGGDLNKGYRCTEVLEMHAVEVVSVEQIDNRMNETHQEMQLGQRYKVLKQISKTSGDIR